MRLAFIACCAVLFGGCLSGVPSEASEESPVVPGTTLDVPLFAATECVQHHAYFATPAQPFETFLPEGFAFDQTEAGTFDLRIETTACAGPDGAVTQLWIELPVVPPEALAVPDHGSLLPIEAYVSSETLRSALENETVAFVAGCHCESRNLQSTPLVVDEIVSHSLAGVYEMRAVMDAGSGPFGPERWARYIANEGKVTNILLAEGTAAENRAAGAVQFRYQGPGGAPPAHTGIVHSVDGLSWTLQVAPGVQQNL